MKTRHMNYLILVTLVICLTIITGCEKDNPDEPIVKSFRTKSYTYSYDSELYTTNIEYNAANKITKMAKTKNGNEFERDTWVWNGDKVEISNSTLEDGTWVNNGTSQIISYANGVVARSEFTITDSMLFSITYTWNAGLVTKELHELTMSGNLLSSMKVDYIYENGLLTTANYTQNGSLQKHIIEYENGKAVSIKLYNAANQLTESSDFIRTGDIISEIRKYHVEQGVQGEVDCTENLAYNSNGKIDTLTKLCDGDAATLTTSITYEEGEGNYGDYILTVGCWFRYHLFHDTFPAEMINTWK